MFANRSGKFSYDLTCNNDVPRLNIYVDGQALVCVSNMEYMKGKTLSGPYWKFTMSRSDIECVNFDWDEPLAAHPLVEVKRKCLKVGTVEFQKKYGITPTHAAKIVNGIVYSTCIKPYIPYQNIFKQGARRKILPAVYRSVVLNFELLEQARADGLMHLTPLIARFGKDPQEFRKLLGKAEWKKMAGNTFSRNNKIAAAAAHTLKSIRVDTTDADLRDVLIELNNCRSTVLSSPSYAIPMQWLATHTKVPMKKLLEQKYEHRRAIDIYLDTRQSARDLNLPFNTKWSLRKMEEKHGEYTIEMRDKAERDRRERDVLYRQEMERLEKVDLTTVFDQTVWKEGESCATILTKHKRVRDEGCEMGHCVGGYADRVIRGDYIVATIKSENGDRSTVGFHTDNEDGCLRVSFNQHYGRYNERVKNPEHLKLAQTVLQSLQQMNLTKEKYDEAKTR